MNNLTYAHTVRIKYFGPTDTKPSRIKAIWQSADYNRYGERTFKSKTISRDYANERDGYAIWAAEQCLEYLNTLNGKPELAIDNITLGFVNEDEDVVLFTTYYPEHEEPSK